MNKDNAFRQEWLEWERILKPAERYREALGCKEANFSWVSSRFS